MMLLVSVRTIVSGNGSAAGIGLPRVARGCEGGNWKADQHQPKNQESEKAHV